ncbi:MAG TPA: hypothetical protein VHV78_03865 [Gemmatimonadaceae bacterium]|jgi:hypothetical protein|nr:hypothetical protein [Gemmatimonadaceae bacterium]
MRFMWLAALALLLCVWPTAGALGAQSVEVPVAFDGARRIYAMTPDLAARLVRSPASCLAGD